MTEKKLDRRVVLTKKQLKESLLELLQEKEIQKISVRAICELADLNRSTFYKHYGSQYELLQEMEEDLANEIQQSLKDADTDFDLKKQLIYCLCYLRENMKLCCILFKHHNGEKLLHLPVLVEKVRSRILGKSERHVQYVHEFMAFGTFQLVKRWIENECREEPEEIVEVIMEITRAVFPEVGC